MADGSRAGGSRGSDPLGAAFEGLIDALRDGAAWVREHPFFEDDENRAGAYMFLVHMLLSGIEEHVVFDPDFPSFRVIDPRTRGGGDNSDQRYLMSRITGGATYRIWGRIGAERRVELQTYAGDPYMAGGGGRSADFLAHEDLRVERDGTFEVIVSPEPQPGNWLENPPDGTRILVRQTYGTWADADIGEIHIDRVGAEGDAKPDLTPDDLRARLDGAATYVGTHVEVWPEMVRGLFVDSRPPNQISDPVDPGKFGGVSGRFMAFGLWDLAPDEALVVTTWPASGNYQGIQLTDLWYSSLEYANRQTSLTGDQARLDAAGSYTTVLAAVDPGVANWLDTMGRRRGVIILRYDGTTVPEFDPERRPVARVVKLAEFDAELGPGVARIGPDERRAEIAARRRHVQARFGF